jgi:hypothetical protein
MALWRKRNNQRNAGGENSSAIENRRQHAKMALALALALWHLQRRSIIAPAKWHGARANNGIRVMAWQTTIAKISSISARKRQRKMKAKYLAKWRHQRRLALKM